LFSLDNKKYDMIQFEGIKDKDYKIIKKFKMLRLKN